MFWQNLIESGSPPCSPQIPNLIFDFCAFSLHAYLINFPTPETSMLTNGSILYCFQHNHPKISRSHLY